MREKTLKRATKAVVLARVSSKEQEDGKSLIAQENNAKEYCVRNGLSILQVFSIVESSTQGTRKNFHMMLDFIREQKECIAIVSDTVDRFQRSFKETLELEPMLKAGKVELHFVSNGLVLHHEASANDISIWNMCVIMAQNYVLQLSDNTKRGLRQKIKDGEWCTKAPVGYENTIDEQGKKIIIIDPRTGPIIKKLFEMYATGNYSVQHLTDWLQREGIKSERGTPYSHSSIYSVLKNPFYYGVMKINGQKIPHVHGALISKELFDICQNVRLGYHKQHHNYGCKEFVFRGNITCADCGTLISPYTKARKTKAGIHYHTYLMCSHYKAKKEGFVCSAEPITEEYALEQIQSALEKIKIEPEILSVILEDLNNSTANEIEFLKNKEIAAKKRLPQINIQRNSLFSKQAAGLISEEYLEAQLQVLKEEEELLLKNIQNHSEEQAKKAYTVESLLKLINKLPVIFKNCSKVEEKRAIINLVLSNVQLKGKNLEISYKKPFGYASEGYESFNWGG